MRADKEKLAEGLQRFAGINPNAASRTANMIIEWLENEGWRLETIENPNEEIPF